VHRPCTPAVAAPPSLAEEIDFLRHHAWPSRAELIETHLSCVFLTADRVYKLKKPVQVSFVDYRSLEARRLDCEAEVDLNGALAPGVYLGTRPLRRLGSDLTAIREE
jgi:aminoglycoside phosphotransferase family enzyme